MSKFIFVVEMPKPGISSHDYNAPTRGLAFLEESSAIVLPPGHPPKPALNFWLLDAEGSDTILSRLVACAQKHELPHSTFLVSGEVKLLTAG